MTSIYYCLFRNMMKKYHHVKWLVSKLLQRTWEKLKRGEDYVQQVINFLFLYRQSIRLSRVFSRPNKPSSLSFSSLFQSPDHPCGFIWNLHQVHVLLVLGDPEPKVILLVGSQESVVVSVLNV